MTIKDIVDSYYEAIKNNDYPTETIENAIAYEVLNQLSGGVTGDTATYGIPQLATITTNAEDLLEVDSNRKIVEICNTSNSVKVYLNIGADAGFNAAIFILQPEQTLILDNGASARISAIASEETTVTYRIKA